MRSELQGKERGVSGEAESPQRASCHHLPRCSFLSFYYFSHFFFLCCSTKDRCDLPASLRTWERPRCTCCGWTRALGGLGTFAAKPCARLSAIVYEVVRMLLWCLTDLQWQPTRTSTSCGLLACSLSFSLLSGIIPPWSNAILQVATALSVQHCETCGTLRMPPC